MKKNRLYVIGNGFDLFHGIESKYSDFQNYVSAEDDNLYESLEKYFSSDELWSDFEGTLAYLDVDTIKDEAEESLVSYSDDDWSDSYHHEYQYIIQRVIDAVTIDLKKAFTKWILELKIPDTIGDKKLELQTNARYLTFNYTPTLECLYKIPSSNILHIHNKAVDINSTLILGHSRKLKEEREAEEREAEERELDEADNINGNVTIHQNKSESESDSGDDDNNYDDNEYYQDDDIDVRVVEGDAILDAYFENTYKNTQMVILEHIDFFFGLKNIEEIYVLGHSLSYVDLRYFQEIVKNININTVQWKVSYYGDRQKEEHQKVLTALGIPQNLILLENMNNF